MNDTLLARLAAERQLRLAKSILPYQFLPTVVLPNTLVGPRVLAAQLVLVQEPPLVGDDQVARGVFNIHESIADTERLDVVATPEGVVHRLDLGWNRDGHRRRAHKFQPEPGLEVEIGRREIDQRLHRVFRPAEATRRRSHGSGCSGRRDPLRDR